MKKMILILSMLLLCPGNLLAETYWGGELPNIRETRLNVEMALTDGIYSYTYTIISGNSNTGQIWSFDIDVKKPENGKDLDSTGLVNGPGYLKHTSAQVLSESTTPKMIPVGLFSPLHWNSGPDVLGQVGWGANDNQFRIVPGSTLSDFKITSRGLPGLRNFIVLPDLIPPSEESDITSDQIDAVENQVSFKGISLGPTAPPAHLIPVDFVAYIIDLKHQAATLGWIGGPKFVLELDKMLDQIKSKLGAGENEPAREELGAFIEKVESHYKETRENETEKVKEGEKKGLENKKFITSEGYALLKFNAAYLRDQLGKPKEMEDDKEQEKEQKK